MSQHAALFAEYCRTHFDLRQSITFHPFRSLSVCIIDCVYSLRARYDTVTVPIIERYAQHYLNGDAHSPDETISMLIRHFDELPDHRTFADDIVKNHQVSGGVPKEEVCYQLARKLSELHIETVEDFRQFLPKEQLESAILSVTGIGEAAADYLFMLAGDTTRCKNDRHIRACVEEVTGQRLSNAETQALFQETVKILKDEYPAITENYIDFIIWNERHSQ